MESFQLVHASDLHFYARNVHAGTPLLPAPAVRARKRFLLSSHNHEIAVRFRDFVDTQLRSRDAMIITGDLATTGERQDLGAARDFLEAWIQANPARPLVLLPGNHDRYTSDRILGRPTGRPGGVAYHQVFREYAAPRPGGAPESETYGRIYVEPRLVRPRLGQRLILISADFTLASNDKQYSLFGRFGLGRATAGTMEKLVEVTRKMVHRHSRERVFVIWCLHFNPDYSRPNLWLRLLERRRVRSALKDRSLRVAAVLCGHTHKPDEKTLEGIPLLITGAVTCIGAPHVFHTHAVCPRKGGVDIESVRYTYQPESYTAPNGVGSYFKPEDNAKRFSVEGL